MYMYKSCTCMYTVYDETKSNRNDLQNVSSGRREFPSFFLLNVDLDMCV